MFYTPPSQHTQNVLEGRPTHQAEIPNVLSIYFFRNIFWPGVEVKEIITQGKRMVGELTDHDIHFF